MHVETLSMTESAHQICEHLFCDAVNIIDRSYLTVDLRK